MENEDKLLGICSMPNCKAIRINNEKKTWLLRDVIPDLYDRFMEKYDGKLTHGICPDCMQKHYPEDANPQRKQDYLARNTNSNGLVKNPSSNTLTGKVDD